MKLSPKRRQSKNAGKITLLYASCGRSAAFIFHLKTLRSFFTLRDYLLSMLWAFLVGGGLCGVAQLLLDFTKLTPARILVLYVSLGVILGAVGLYEPLYRFAGAGVAVPLLGFGGNVARGVKEAVHQFGWLGVFMGPFTAASAGTSAALIFAFLGALLFTSKPKRL